MAIDTPNWNTPYGGGGLPSGIPDPNNPGYDTNGFPLMQTMEKPGVDVETPIGNAPDPGQPTPTTTFPTPPPGVPAPTPPPTTPPPTPPPTAAGPEASGTGEPPPPPAAPNLGGGALANYAVPPPAFPTEPAFEGTQFQAPSIAEALNDPGYQFERDESLNGLQRWAAARGTLNDTGTATALMDVGRNAATQRLGDVWGRDFTAWNANEDARRQAYGINRTSQFIDPWTAQYNAWQQQGNWYLQNQGTVAGTALGFAQL